MMKNKLVQVLACGVLTFAVVAAVAAVEGPDALNQAELVWPIGNSPTM